MRHLLILAALLLAAPAYAMNKCVGANGRITYQQDPCPGTVVRAAPKPPAPEKPAPAAEVPPAPPRPALAEGNTACERIRQKIAEINEKLPAASIEQIVEAQRIVSRAREEYPDCNL